jgi:hypothetical protein
LSVEAQLLLNPAATFREFAQDTTSGTWVLLRRPLGLAFVLGCIVSLLVSGRLSARLITDGVLSFAFVPTFEMAALGILYCLGERRVPFARAVDLFFAAHAPWLLWLLAFAMLRCLQSPRQAAAPPLSLLWALELSLLPVAAWSGYIDLHFFREVLPRPGIRPLRDLMLQRAIGWSGTLLYFLGYALWPEIVVRIGG